MDKENWRHFLLVARREVLERMRSRMYRIGLILTALIAVVSIVAPKIFDHESAHHDVVAYSSALPTRMIDALHDITVSTGNAVTTNALPSDQEGDTAIRQGAAQVFVRGDGTIVTKHASTPTAPNPLADAVGDIVTREQAFLRAALTPAQAEVIAQRPPPHIIGLVPTTQGGASEKDAMSAMTGVILLFVFLTMYGAFILNGVIEEKSNRVVEILLSTIRPQTLLAGRIAGIAVVGGVQGAVIAATALISRTATNAGADAAFSPRVLLLTALWFGLGFAMYSWLFACAGALVSRSEDAPSIVFPLQVPLMISYAMSFIAAQRPDVAGIVPLSLFPLTAPMVMLQRMAAGTVPLWQSIVSVLLCIVSALLIRKLAVVIFTGSILRNGQRVKLRTALKGDTA